MLRSYIKTRNRDKFDDVEKGKIWNRVYSTHLDIKTALEEAFRKSKDYGTMGEQMLEKGMVYLNRYWSRAARRHPEIFEQYDKTELFNEALEELAKEGTISNYTVTLNGYDKNIPLMNQPEHIRNNIKMDYMWDRWGSASTVVERFTPGGFYNIEAETNLMKMISRNELREYDTLEKAQEAALEYKDSYMDPSDITTIIHYQTANTIYGRLIGIAANQNIHQKLLSMMDICSMVKYAKDGSPVANPIRFGSMISRATTDENIGVSLVERYKGTGANRIDSELNLAENLAAAVDAVKQSTLEYFDITPFTFGMVALAVKVGATPQDIGLLFNQPVVKEALRLMEKGERTFDTALKKAYAAMNDNKPYKSEEHIDVNLDSDTLYKAIYHYQGGYKYTDKAEGKVLRQQNSLLAVQSRVVDTILALSANTQDFKSFLNSGKATSSNSVGSDISSLEHLLYSVNKTMVEFGNASAGSRFNIKSKSGNKVFDLSLPLIVDGDINPGLIDTLSENEFGIETMVLYCFKEFLDSTKAEFPYRSDGYMAVKDAIATLGKDYNLGSKCGVPSAQILKLINQQLPTYLLGRYANFSDVNLEDFSSGKNLEATREKIAENQTYLNDFKDAYEGEIIIFDVESTGIDPLIDDIAQLSAKRVVNGEVVEEFNVYLELKDKELPAELGEGKPNPLYELYKNGSISTTSRAEGLQDFLDFIGDAPLVGHNSDNYDVPILLANIKRDLDSNITSLPNSNKQFDTLKLDTIMHPDLSDHKLENLKYYLNFNNSGTSHLADSDVSDTVELAKVILGDFAKLGNKVPRKYVSNRRYFLAKFMRELSEAKQDPEINDYAIINMINLKQGRYGAYIEFEGLGRLQGEEKNAIIDSWVAMLNSPNERVSKLAKDLFIYDFHTKGLSAFGKNVANSVTPSDIKSYFADYIDFARKLNSLTVEDGNFILNGKSLGTVNEFITMLLINSINPNQSSNTHWEYIHTVTKDELDELLKDSRLKSILTDSSSDGESESDLEITIANPGRNTAFSSFFQSTWQDGNGVTVRQFYPILRIGKRVYYANSLTTINGETYSHVALETKDGNNSFVTMRYSLAIGNDSKNTRTHVSTVDFSDFSSEDRNIGGISDIEKDILPPESSSIEEATSSDSECVRKVAIGETVFVDKMRAAKVARDLSIALGLDREYINRLQDGNAADKQLYSDLMMIAAVAGYSNLSEGLGAFIGTRDRQRNPVYARVSDNAIAKAADIIANRMTVNSTTDVTISNAEALHQEAQEIARLQNLCY